jgi:hypothetical protein
MGKIITPYGGFMSADIISRATANVAVLTISGANIDATNVTITGIKNAISESVTGEVALCTSLLVNKWSWFGPVEWYYSGTEFLNRVKTPHKMGDFMGYNHLAIPPTFQVKPLTIIHNEGNNSVEIQSYIRLGEIDWKGINGGIMGIKCDLLDGVSVVASQVVAIGSSYLNQQQNFNLALNTTSLNYDKTYTVSIYFSDNTDSIFSPVPNLSDYSVLVKWNPYARVGTNDLSQAVKTANPTWVLLKGATSVQQGTYGYIVNYDGIDSNANGQGDISVSLSVYARKNGGSWISLSLIAEFMPGNSWGMSGTLPFPLNYGDIVDFQLGY